jgi:MbtH protein
MMSNDDDTTVFKVVVNHEEQYSIWPAARENPIGWRDEGTQGLKAVCLAHIKEIWTDMRPLSLRRKMDQDAKAPSGAGLPNQAQGSDEVGS